MEVLLEYESSRRLLKPSEGFVTRSILEDEFKKTGWRGSIEVGDAIPTDESDESELSTCNNTYILQRWEARWNCFIDVCSVDEIKSNDRLTIVLKPGAGTEQTGTAVIKVSNHFILFILFLTTGGRT